MLYVDRQNRVHVVSARSGKPETVQLVRVDFFNREAREKASDEQPGISKDTEGSSSSEHGSCSMTLPPSAVPFSAARDLSGRIRLRWKQPATFGWNLFPDTESDDREIAGLRASSGSTNTMSLPVEDWRRFQQNRYEWGNPPPVLTLQLSQRKQRLSFFTAKSEQAPHNVDVPDQSLVNVVTYGSRLLRVTKQEVHRLELNLPLVKAFTDSQDGNSE